MLTHSTRGLHWTLSACLCAALCVGCGSSSKPADEKAGTGSKSTAGGPPVDPEPADAPSATTPKTGDSNIVPAAAISGSTPLKVADPDLTSDVTVPISVDPEGSEVLTTINSKPSQIPTTGAKAQPKEDEAKDDKADPDNIDLQATPKEGTADWYVYEATKLRMQAIAPNEDPDKAKAARKERNEKIVDYAQKAVALIHDKPEQARLFQTAIRNLLDARLQLALAGEKDHIEAMYDDAAALAKRDPNSQVAAEAARALVELAYINASKSSQKDDTLWLQEFATLATHFATQFPREEPRSAPLLFTAAQSCENYGLTTDAMSCYATILEKFPNNKYAAKATSILRRLRLPGRSVELAGPSLNGKYFDVTSLRGKPVLVVFWASTAQPCIEQMPQIIDTAKKFTPSRLAVMGVTLDPQPAPVSEFLISQKIGWPQIFHVTAEKNEQDPNALRWDHPIVDKYGISKIPTMWLLDRTGKVVSTNVSADDLEESLTKLCDKTIPASATVVDETPATPRKKPTATKAGATRTRAK